MKDKHKLEDYSESEFLNFVGEFFENKTDLSGEKFGIYLDRCLEHFISVVEHPEASDLIYYPEEGEEDSPEGVVKRVKAWRAQAGKPGFKQP